MRKLHDLTSEEVGCLVITLCNFTGRAGISGNSFVDKTFDLTGIGEFESLLLGDSCRIFVRTFKEVGENWKFDQLRSGRQGIRSLQPLPGTLRS